jgi:hypothetical protein
MSDDDFMLHQIREEQKVCFEEIMACLDRIEHRMDSPHNGVRLYIVIPEKKLKDHA